MLWTTSELDCFVTAGDHNLLGRKNGCDKINPLPAPNVTFFRGVSIQVHKRRLSFNVRAEKIRLKEILP